MPNINEVKLVLTEMYPQYEFDVIINQRIEITIKRILSYKEQCDFVDEFFTKWKNHPISKKASPLLLYP